VNPWNSIKDKDHQLFIICSSINQSRRLPFSAVTASDKVYQLLAHGRRFSLDTSASSTTKTGRHDIAESGIKTPKIVKSSILL
jgi:hypothetical protein